MRRTLIAVTVVALAAAGAAAAKAPAKRPIAFIHIDARVGCANAKSCKILPPWMRSLRNPMDVVVFADGTLYYRARVITVGRAGAGPHRCDSTLFAKPFSGACTVSDFGIGFVRKTTIPGPYRGPDVWVASESALVGGNARQLVDAFGPYPSDTGNPLTPGHYSLRQLVTKPQPGETESVDVIRRALP